jgi:SAM-dependent methyltransferase
MSNAAMIKRLARLSELQSHDFDHIMKKINQIAADTGLQHYITYSRIWEYPWAWFQLEPLKGRELRVLDVGSERSPFPWFLATQGFNVIVSDVTAKYWRVWQRATRQLGVSVHRGLLDTQGLDLPTASVDVYLSVSIMEHVRGKTKAIAEAARVLRPGGLFVMTFDICEADMGMSFPGWNGRALSMREFDNLFRNSPWFEPGLSELPWNVNDILDYLAWHRTTASHHNYVTGAAVVRRNDRIWEEPAWIDYLRTSRRKICTASSVASCYLGQNLLGIKQKVAPYRAVREICRRLTMQPLESLRDAPDLFHVYRSLHEYAGLERKPGGWIYKGGFYPDYLTVGGAGHAIFPEALRVCQGHGIDVGAGLWPLPGAIPVDVWRGPGKERSISEFEDSSLDYVFSSHCLEHIENWRETLSEWRRKLRPNGIIFLYLPHPLCDIWHPGSPFVGDGHKWIPTPEIVKQALMEIGCKILQVDDGPDAMQSFYVCGQRHVEVKI